MEDDLARDPALVNDAPAGHRPTGFDPARVACYDCAAPYDDPAWIEAVVPHDIWNNHLSPTGDEGGILCIVCMARRATSAGLSDIPLKLTAGPFK